ncbi:MAG: universal stress protein [Paludibacteraceae bacterium]|nr:universal stress protein [Paludibacteraceae bacterium]
MEDNLVTLAIHTYEKAQRLKSVLEVHGIDACLQSVNQFLPVGTRVRIKESDLPKALGIIEEMNSKDGLNGALEEINKKPMVLLPIDFSDYSMKACEFAFPLAAKLDAEVVLFHAYLPPSFSTMPIGDVINHEGRTEESALELLENAKENLIELESKIEQSISAGEWPRTKYRHVLREGVPEDQILGYAERHQPKIIIMGTRGRDKKDMDFIGSVTAEIIERSHVPVFTIPENIALNGFKEIKNVAFSTSFDDKDLIAFDKMMNLLNTNNVSIHFIHFENKDDRWAEIKLSGIKAYFQQNYPENHFEYHLVPGTDILSAYDEFIHQNNIDAIALTTHKRSLISRLFNPSMARKMIFHTDTPMFVFHA